MVGADFVLALAALLGGLGFQDGMPHGTVPPASLCLPNSGLVELSGCAAMVEITQRCSARETVEGRLQCACVQELLNSYQDCKSDIYKCVGTNLVNVINLNIDDVINKNIADWHQACDPRLASFTTITTPPEPTLTSTYNVAECYRLAGSCYSADRETNLCRRQWLPTSSISFISCACQPPIHSLMSECQYNGNISCKLEPAAESNILGYRECSYFWMGSETLPPVDLTSFLSITQAEMKATDAAEALRAAGGGMEHMAHKTWTTVTQTDPPSLGQQDL
ncbi:hypothetical protein QBC34DRAFT_406610 [Podospora aff. communis PSN243]|uniref:Extracellular membrane protein CFEM domain-containing protein n=1 Tax=Podospora aff. communis PSN243 TaxID=3040156 RepID=A0AAV9GK41_9PEZI|nr:hypothetical protein QBC34DRAFT_406610 [Podospora aff. communis PSN243]